MSPADHEPVSDRGLVCVLSQIPGLTHPKVLRKAFYFQCAPVDTMPQDYSWTWDDYATIDSGMHSNPQAHDLDTFTFSSLFVDADWQHRWTLTKNVHVLGAVKMLRVIGDTMRPFQMQFGQPLLWTDWEVVRAVTMRSLHVEERAGESDARYFTVTFREYADATTVDSPRAPPETVRRSPTITEHAPPRPKDAPIIREKGWASAPGVLVTLDSATLPESLSTLAQIAKAYYHETSSWRVIAKASGLRSVSANQDLRATAGAPAARIVVPDLAKRKGS